MLYILQTIFLVNFCFAGFHVGGQSAANAKKNQKINAQKRIHELEKITGLYSSQNLYSKFKRKQTLSLLGEVEETKGELYYSNSRLRMEMGSPIESLVIITPFVIWNVNYNKKKVESVVKAKPVSNPLLSLLFGDKKVWSKFKIINVHTNNKNRLDISLEPKRKKEVSYVSQVRISINKKRNIVRKLTYWDDIDNKIELKFTYNKFKSKISDSKFKYTPPKGVSVSEM